MKYKEYKGQGATTKLRKKKFNDNYDLIFGRKEKYYDSDETVSWDEDKIDIIGLNDNTGEHYIK
jgi:hypothetical protein